MHLREVVLEGQMNVCRVFSGSDEHFFILFVFIAGELWLFLNIGPSFIIGFSLRLGDPVLNFILILFEAGISNKLFPLILVRVVDDGFGLLHNVVGLILFYLGVFLVSILVESGLIFLIHQSVSHVLVLMESHGDSNMLFDYLNHFLPGFLLCLLVDLRLGSLEQMILFLEHFINKSRSRSLDFFVNLTFKLRCVSEIVSVGVNCGANLFSQADQRSCGSNGVEEFEYEARRHILL